MDCCSGAGVTRCLTNTAALTGPAAALKLLLYWLNVCFCDFVQSVGMMLKVSMLGILRQTECI